MRPCKAKAIGLVALQVALVIDFTFHPSSSSSFIFNSQKTWPSCTFISPSVHMGSVDSLTPYSFMLTTFLRKAFFMFAKNFTVHLYGSFITYLHKSNRVLEVPETIREKKEKKKSSVQVAIRCLCLCSRRR